MKIQMKRTLAGLCAAVACTSLIALPQTASAQVGASGGGGQQASMLPDAKQIIDQAMKAMGGEDAFKKIESQDIAFEMEAGPQIVTCAVKSLSKDDKEMFNAEMQVMGMVIKMGSDGETMWQTNPMNGQYSILSDAQAEQAKGITGIAGMQTFVGDVKDDAAVLETVDKTTFEGKTCYKVRMVPKDEETGEPMNAEQMFMFFDAEKHLPVGMESTQQGAQMKMVFKEWKDVNGMMLPTRMEGQQGPQTMNITFKKYEYNTLDASAFELPAEVKALKGDGATTRPGG